MSHQRIEPKFKMGQVVMTEASPGGFKELGLHVIKHCDGNLWPIIDMVVDSGIDCLDPIDPVAGMDIGAVKAAFRS